MKLIQLNKNGTAKYLLNDGRLILSYQSGYVRISTKGDNYYHRRPLMYQINPVVKIWSNGGKYYHYERVLLNTEIKRLEFIINFVKRNVK